MKRLSIGLVYLFIIFSLVACTTKNGSGESTMPVTTPSQTTTTNTTDTGEATETTNPNPTPPGEEIMTYKEVGPLIKLEALEERHAVLVNSQGMSGRDGRIHLHDTDPQAMYKGNDTEFIFDIGHIERLGELYLWNYNEAGQTDSGIREILVDSSLDNITYGKEHPLTLDPANGEVPTPAHGLEDRDTVDFSGESGRYIRIRVLSNHGGSENGLSELRLYRYRQENREESFISLSPVEQFNNSRWSASPEDYNMVNGSGLSDNLSADATHDNNPAHMFAGDAKLMDIIVDLQGHYPISEVLIWNYNDPDALDSGLKTFRLSVSADMSRWQLLGQYEMERGDGSDALPVSLKIDVDNIQAHYIKLEIRDNYGGEQVGISEIAVRMGSGWYTDAVPDYTALLSNFDGWAGADGIYTVNLDGKDYLPSRNPADLNTYFVFSDTITGRVDGATDLRSQIGFVNNTAAILKGTLPRVEHMEFILPNSSALIVPDPPIPASKAGKEIYYWLGDTFVEGGHLYVFALRIDTVNTLYGFEQIGVDLARYDIVDGVVDPDSLTLINDDAGRLSRVDQPQSKFYFGGGVFQNTEAAGTLNPDGYTYIYGYNDLSNQGRQLVVARVESTQIEDFTAWRYLAADGTWSEAIPDEFMLLQSDVAPELSVSEIRSGEHRGKYLLVWQHITVSPTIRAAIADTPYSVFEQVTTIFTHDTHLKIVGQANTTYNAKAHPALSGENEIIISYNINGGTDAFKYGDIYRPRFIRTARVAKGED